MIYLHHPGQFLLFPPLDSACLSLTNFWFSAMDELKAPFYFCLAPELCCLVFCFYPFLNAGPCHVSQRGFSFSCTATCLILILWSLKMTRKPCKKKKIPTVVYILFLFLALFYQQKDLAYAEDPVRP